MGQRGQRTLSIAAGGAAAAVPVGLSFHERTKTLPSTTTTQTLVKRVLGAGADSEDLGFGKLRQCRL